ncbi:TonB-dependent receptor [Sphingomonas cannabina]|uniref:TonB-dependent receptor n=1 Tax=Sphingomonas cannabina TaxID=2899123 RepID=UPI001F3864C1|nr:TonB-dependent receptor [Sphingomonas cannabina]UIJ45023.1 TonB-dependent receptor [Sphingomonas cannabina]
MLQMSFTSPSHLRLGASATALALMLMTSPAIAQTSAPADQTTAPAQEEDIVVTGFRASLSTALAEKRQETAAVDSILAEDIGKFPDSNLAESMQRIPGVALARGDGGEGRNISVRGLGAQFTRVRINGMEGTSQTGGSDIFGAGNSGRSFDFNVFPTEIFSALTVRKTPSADVEEGSLGATVDLTAPKPLDTGKPFVFSATARGVWNELSKKVDPRASMLVSKQFGDSGFGILASAAYQKRNLREVGYSAVDLLPANVNGGFCSPVGYTPQNPATSAAKGTDALNCSTGNPRTGSVAAYQAIQDLRRADAPNIPGSGAFFPRIPRYVNSEQDQERIGGTLTLQFKPDDATDISLDLLYSRFDVTRRDNYIAGLSFARSISNNGQPMVSVRDVEFDENGSLVYGLFDGVDVRSEGLVDHFVSTFKQANLNFKRRLNDSLEISGVFGLNQSVWDGKKRLQTFMDVIDSDNFSIDYRGGGTVPTIGFGFDVANPGAFTYAPSLADGTVLGGFSFQGRPQKNTTDNFTGDVNLKWTVSDAFTLRVGGQYRESRFHLVSLRPYSADLTVRPLPAGTSLADITTQITGLDNLWGHGAPASWAAIDADRWAEAFDFDSVRFCGSECGGVDTRVNEEIKSAYIMGTFDLGDRLGIGLRGDIGVRYVKTDMRSSGYIQVTPPAGTTSPTNLIGRYASATNSYDDWLPSANIVIEPTRNVLIRLSGAKVMARPELGLLAPTSGVNAVTRTGSINNPYLDPIRANTFDAALEWYFRPGSLLSVAFFYKDIKSFIQNINSQIAFSELGLPNALLEGSNTAPTELFNISQPFNTPGGPLKGIEVNAQVPFTFLPGFLRNFGALANYTYASSKIDYCLASSGGACTVSTRDDLIGLSKNTASGTLYYEDKKFSIRGTVNWRDRFIRGIPASQGSDIQGNAPTLYVDASASYNVTDNIKLIVEAQNLTDEQNRLYIDSTRQDTLFETRIGRTVSAGVNVRF